MQTHRQTIKFPPVESADADGLLCVGGCLSPAWLLEAYRRGIFPWPFGEPGDEILAWFSPDPRAVIELDAMHVSRRLGRRMRNQFRVSFDTAFDRVVDACAAPRPDEPLTWITPEIKAAYRHMHELGYAHSVEVWQGADLVGGLYGVAMKGYFAGESMFHIVRDASKAALAWLVERLRDCGFSLLDVQVMSDHLARLGATTMPRPAFLTRLEQAMSQDTTFRPHG